jgi:hypothetical protein
MTYTEREEIMSKDVMTGADIQKLQGCNASQASRIITDIKYVIEKRGGKPRIDQRGKLHTQDYCEFYKIARF